MWEKEENEAKGKGEQLLTGGIRLPSYFVPSYLYVSRFRSASKTRRRFAVLSLSLSLSLSLFLSLSRALLLSSHHLSPNLKLYNGKTTPRGNGSLFLLLNEGFSG